MADALETISSSISRISQQVSALEKARDLLTGKLLPGVDKKVSERSPGVSIRGMKIESENGDVKVINAATGTGGYATRINLKNPGFHCTCPDFEKRQRACKHVIALASQAVEKIETTIEDMVDTSNGFTEHLKSLESSLNRLAMESEQAVAFYDSVSKVL